MKRSKAVELIGKLLMFGVYGLDKDKQLAYKDKSLGDIILTELEAEGMLPPSVATLKIFDSVVRAENKWEPEDGE